MLILSSFYYFSIWYILSGKNDLLFILIGIFVSLILSYNNIIDRQNSKIKFLSFIKYSAWLIKEVVISSVKTIKIIITGKIIPSFERIEISNISELGHTIFDNSITLTPGTVCISDNDSFIVVHALHDEFLHDIKSGLLEDKMRKTVTK